MANHKAQSKPLTITQAKVVKAKIRAEIEDLPILVVARDVFPNSAPNSARTMMHRELQNVTVQEALEESFRKLGLTTDTLTATVAHAITANKTVPIEGDLFETDVPDYGIRLKAAGMAANWMGIGKQLEVGGGIHFHNHTETTREDYGI